MTNSQIISLKNRLRTHFDIDRLLDTFSDEVWENNFYGQEYENLTEENFKKYFSDAILNPTKEEEKPMCWECTVSQCDDIEFSICDSCMHKHSIEQGECYPRVNIDEDDDVKWED